MTNIIRSFVVAAAAVTFAASTAAAQATIHGDLTKDWAAQKDTMVKIANAMPDDKLGFKPTPAQRSFAEQIGHVTQVNMMLLNMLGAKAPKPAINTNATSKADRIKAMADTFDYGSAILKEFDDKGIQETVQAAFLGPSTRARILYFIIAHTQDIYGQMAVYLRLNGVVPPASQRP